MNPGTIIILNGTSSSGKSSLCKAFQVVSDEPFMHMSLDAFAEFLPRDYFGEDESRWSKIRQFQRGFHQAARAFSQTSHPVIVDQIVIRHGLMEILLETYSGLPAFFVGLNCPLEELKRRELNRGIQSPGLAQGQLQGIHLNKIYDLGLDSFQFSPENCANHLKEHILKHAPFAFDQLCARLAQGEMIGKQERK